MILALPLQLSFPPNMLASSLFSLFSLFLGVGIVDAAIRDAEARFGLGKGGRVEDLGQAVVLTALLEVDPGGRGVGKNVPPDWLDGRPEHGHGPRVGHDLRNKARKWLRDPHSFELGAIENRKIEPG